MAHAYTPGLRVADAATVRRERRLPLHGEVLVTVGAEVGPDTVVARAQLPGNVQALPLAARLGLDPAQVLKALQVPVGATVRAGERLAEWKGLLGLVRTTVEAPVDGTVESVSTVTGQLLLREPPIPVEVAAYVRGRVAEVLPGEGVVVESSGALVQGIFGVGGETFGPLRIAAPGPEAELSVRDLAAVKRGDVVVAGAFVTAATLEAARERGVAAVVVGGFDGGDLRRLLGRDLGVAITGGEAIGFTLVMTEGFGRIPMAPRTWDLLRRLEGRVASVSGATQIRAGVLRPEILVPGEAPGGAAASAADDGGLAVGSLVRMIREPGFGRLGRVVELPSELQALETEARVRVLVLEFADSSGRATVPRANVERLAP